MSNEENTENEQRRDDELERNFSRGNDRDNQEYDLRRRMAEQSFQQSAELFNLRQTARDVQASVDARETQAYSGLTFRDAGVHSTAVGSLEGEIAAVGAAMQEEVQEEEEKGDED